MDMITIEELKNLSGRSDGWCVSLFMPAHRHGRDTEQDPIRFRNLLREAESRLLDKGLRVPDVKELLAPAHALLPDSAFWWHQSDGLAVFISEETFRAYRLPLPFGELVVIANRFHLKPVLPIFTGDGHFYILALSQNQVRLLEGNRQAVDEVETETRLPALAEALQFERFEKQLQFHTGTAGGRGARPAVFHGHDASDEDKKRLLRWFHKIDDELPAALGDARHPLVLAGVDYLFPLYREASSYPALLDKGVTGNPEELKPHELHAQAWPLVEPVFLEAREKAAGQYHQLAGSGRTTDDIRQAVSAAHHGRVDTLFAAAGVQLWGRYDPAADTVELRHEPQPGDEDLLDLAAVQSILNGGTVYVVEPDQVPGGRPVAAIYRY
jgi:hypothetical protein